MSIRKSITMLTNTGTTWGIVSEPVRGNAYYGYGNAIHTLQVIYQNFTGAFGIQATLVLDPKEDDWFWIKINDCSNLNYYPDDPYKPTGKVGDTGSQCFTFVGNFTYVRFVMDRSYMDVRKPDIAWDKWEFGQIDKVLLSL